MGEKEEFIRLEAKAPITAISIYRYAFILCLITYILAAVLLLPCNNIDNAVTHDHHLALLLLDLLTIYL